MGRLAGSAPRRRSRFLVAALVLPGLLAPGPAGADEPPPWAGLPPTDLAYRIEVTLDPATRALHGREEIRWRNPSDRPIDRVPVHLYLNAFAHGRTTFHTLGFLRDADLEELVGVWRDPWGHIDLTSVVMRAGAGPRPVAHGPIRPDDGNPFDASLVELRLPEPVAPGAVLALDVAFEARLPFPQARTGGSDHFFFVGQWFPKIGAFEAPGVRGAREPRFAARQFRGPTEFYADFADWDVTITAPEAFRVVATGVGGTVAAEAPRGARRHHFQQRAVHDFAWVAGTRLVEEVHPHAPGGRLPPVEIHYVVPAGTAHQIPRLRRAAEATFDVLTDHVGAYPYPRFTVVQPPLWAVATSAMEYPMLVGGMVGDRVLDRLPGVLLVEQVVAHEVTHNWFYGLLASNEQEEAFLDEGFTDYWTTRILEVLGPGGASGGTFAGRTWDEFERQRVRIARHMEEFREPLARRPSGLFYPGSEADQVYARPSVTLRTAERLFGTERLDAGFRLYFARFALRHPGRADFLAAMRDGGGADLAAFLDEGLTRERVPDFAVVKLEAQRWEAPLGVVPVADGGTAEVTEANRPARSEAGVGLDPAARESDGRVLMEVTDPGFLRPRGEERVGGVERRAVAPLRRAGAAPGADGFWESRAHLDGPAWDHLPVDVEFRFADGVVLRDRWDGRAAWRGYRFLRAAPLDEVRIDPDNVVIVDPRPDNNGCRRDGDRRFAGEWAAWLSGVLAFVEGGLTLWL